MGEYLLSHNGHIDSWPVPVTEIGFELKGKGGQSIQHEFEYFASDFSVQNVKTEGGKTMTAIGRGRGLVYRSGHTMQWRCDNLWHREWFDICDSIMFGFEEAMDYMP